MISSIRTSASLCEPAPSEEEIEKFQQLINSTAQGGKNRGKFKFLLPPLLLLIIIGIVLFASLVFSGSQTNNSSIAYQIAALKKAEKSKNISLIVFYQKQVESSFLTLPPRDQQKYRAELEQVLTTAGTLILNYMNQSANGINEKPSNSVANNSDNQNGNLTSTASSLGHDGSSPSNSAPGQAKSPK